MMTKEEQMETLTKLGTLLMGFCPDCGESFPRSGLDEPSPHSCTTDPTIPRSD